MKMIKSDYEKKRDRNVNRIKKAIAELEKQGLKLYIDKSRETMFGTLVDNIYIRDVSPKGKIYLQKHLMAIYSK